jgi:hypothetical protein
MFRTVSVVYPRRASQAEYPSTNGPSEPGLRRVVPIFSCLRLGHTAPRQTLYRAATMPTAATQTRLTPQRSHGSINPPTRHSRGVGIGRWATSSSTAEERSFSSKFSPNVRNAPLWRSPPTTVLRLDQDLHRPQVLRCHRRPRHLQRPHHRNRHQQLPPRPREAPCRVGPTGLRRNEATARGSRELLSAGLDGAQAAPQLFSAGRWLRYTRRRARHAWRETTAGVWRSGPTSRARSRA